jgi:hypothetical protein
MRALRSYLALLLLLCFTRVLLPDTWVLALHQHQHTSEEPAHVSLMSKPGKARLLLTSRHQHCQTDHFSHASFQLVTPLEFEVMPFFAVVVSDKLYAARPSSVVATKYLRGPPIS